ncbi:polysaccharide deacetylase family protein [Natronobeatus ordinarius]|uniref:polysaccharide deacetylase family protein n=1 Tax=Natronobeatus ordinarius TaxID=2963433 RepID=UPI0020CD3CAA|nr:polysaccharide deacetylase family protein [Natronobeatus ordinarius]
MKRRTYLATATALALAGCTGADDDPNGDDDDDTGADTDSGGGSSNGGPLPDPEPPEEDVTFDDFEDLSPWEVARGSLSADERRSILGTQSARLESDGSADQVRIVRHLEEPLDCTNSSPGLAVATDRTVDPVIHLSDASGNKVVFRQRVEGGLPLVHHNFGIDGVIGEPDMSAVTKIEIILWLGEGASGRLWVDDFHFVSRPSTGAVTIQFAGGYETDYTMARPILEEYDLPAATFVTPGRIRGDDSHDGNRLTEAQLAELADAGWTVGSHTAHDSILTNVDEAEQEAEIREASTWLEEHGYEDGARYFSYPAGRYDETSLELVAEHHDLGFAGSYPAQGQATNPHLCSRVSSPAAAEARHLLAQTIHWGGLTSLTYYQLEDDGLATFEQTMAAISDLESSGDLEVLTLADVESAYLP